MNIYTIYKATNIIDGKSYIGFTSKWPERITRHKYGLNNYKKNGSRYLGTKNNKFYNAIIKYGWENFVWEPIYQSLDEYHTLETMEPHFISINGTINDGYNISEGGDRGPRLPGKSNGMYGRTHSDEVKADAARQASMRFKGKSYEELYGKEKSDKLKEQRSKAWLGRDNSGVKNSGAKTYEITSPDGKKFIVKGELQKFCRENKLDIGKMISVAKDRIPHYKNWTCRYL